VAERIIARESQKTKAIYENRPEAVDAQVQQCFINACLAQILGGQGKYEEATALLREQIDMLPKWAPETTSIAYLWICLGIIYNAMGAQLSTKLPIWSRNMRMPEMASASPSPTNTSLFDGGSGEVLSELFFWDIQIQND